MKKFFIGIPLENSIKKKIVAWKLSHLIQFPEISWKNYYDLHITVIPPFMGDTEIAAQILKEIPKKFSSFKVTFKKIEFGPRKAHPRLIWIKSAEIKKLNLLKHYLKDVYPSLPKTERPFLTHISIARFHSSLFNSFLQKNLDDKVSWSTSVSKLSVYETGLNTNKGRRYRILDTVILPESQD